MRDHYTKFKIDQILSIFIFFIFLFCSYILATTPSVQGYEISIYDEYPTYFWCLIIVCIFLSQLVISLNIFMNDYFFTSWKFACIGIILCISALIALPLVRRYAMLGFADPPTHMAYLLDIQRSGQIGSDPYPALHILGVISNQLCGFNLQIVMTLYPLIVYVLYIFSIYLLYRIILGSRSSILFGMMLAPVAVIISPGMINSVPYFAPQAFADYLIPLFLFLFVSKCLTDTNAFSYSVLVCLVSLSICFFHPLTSIFSAGILGFFMLAYCVIRLSNLHSLNSRLNFNSSSFDTSKKLFLIIMIIFSFWQSYSYILFGSFKKTYAWLCSESMTSSRFDVYSEQMSHFSPDLAFLLKSIIYSYGLYLSITSMGIVSLIYIFKLSRNKQVSLSTYNLMLSTGLIFYFIMYIVSQFLPVTTGYIRVGYYAGIISIYIIPIGLGYLYENHKSCNRSIATIFIVFYLFLFFISYLTVFTCFASPIMSSSSEHITNSYLIGMNSFFENRFEELQIIWQGPSAYRMKDALYGKSKQLNNVRYDSAPIPFHYGYTNASHLGDYYDRAAYLIIGSSFRIFYSNIIPTMFPDHPETWKFNPVDFIILDNDTTVSKFYSNRELDIYLINPLENVTQQNM